MTIFNTKADDEPPVWTARTFSSAELDAQDRRVRREKYAFWAIWFLLNITFIGTYIRFPDSYLHEFLVSMTTYLDVIMMLTVAYHAVKDRLLPHLSSWSSRKPHEIDSSPSKRESIALLMTCYDETEAEMVNSLDSLVTQTGLQGHKLAILIVCDGKLSAAATLHDKVLANDIRSETTVRNAYMSWRRRPVDVDIFTGTYRGVPYCCIVKHQNQAKRDSLLLGRSFLYKHSTRGTSAEPASMLGRELFAALSGWLGRDAGIEGPVDHVVGIDADTLFEPGCVRALLDEARRDPAIVGVAGYLCVNMDSMLDHADKAHFTLWGAFWALFMNAQFFIGQSLVRRFQSLTSGRVTCLPGCCQLLRVCEANCGDWVLRGAFGHYPGPEDSLWAHLLAKVGEDRHHINTINVSRPEARMTMTDRAIAYTNVPRTVRDFFSQRRRWNLSRLSNELLLTLGPKTFWFERVYSVVRMLHFFLFISFRICRYLPLIPGLQFSPARRFRSVVFLVIPRAFYLSMLGLHIPIRDKLYLIAGTILVTYSGAYIVIAATLYTFYYIDYFGWRPTVNSYSDVKVIDDKMENKKVK